MVAISGGNSIQFVAGAELNTFNIDLIPVKPDLGKLLMVKLLNDRINPDAGSPVPVLTEFPPREELECITMSDGGGMGNTDTQIFYQNTALTPDNPYYDPDNPNDQYCTQKIRWDVYEESIALHVWSKTNKIRDRMVRQIRELIARAKMNDYHFCDKYDPSTSICATTGVACDAPLKQTPSSVENRCPYPDITDPNDSHYRDPGAWFIQTGIRMENLEWKGKSSADQLGMVPPIHHTTINFDYIRDEFLVLDTTPFYDFKVNMTLE